MAVRHLGEKGAEEFARILERYFGCTLKYSPRKTAIKVRRHSAARFYGQALHRNTRFHTGLQRAVLHKLGFSDDEIDARYPR